MAAGDQSRKGELMSGLAMFFLAPSIEDCVYASLDWVPFRT